jgi:hypothetical protein
MKKLNNSRQTEFNCIFLLFLIFGLLSCQTEDTIIEQVNNESWSLNSRYGIVFEAPKILAEINSPIPKGAEDFISDVSYYSYGDDDMTLVLFVFETKFTDYNLQIGLKGTLTNYVLAIGGKDIKLKFNNIEHIDQISCSGTFKQDSKEKIARGFGYYNDNGRVSFLVGLSNSDIKAKAKLLKVYKSIKVVDIEQSSVNEYFKYDIDDVGYVFVSNKLELQANEYKAINDSAQKQLAAKFGYKVTGNRIVFQQKGLNEFDSTATSDYVRFILETEMAEPNAYPILKHQLEISDQELVEFETAFKETLLQLGTDGKFKLIEWGKSTIVTINEQGAIRLTYKRQMGTNPVVIVNIYYFFNGDRRHSITIAFREEDKEKWESIMNKSLNSFKITNVLNE